jgi:hypothetical protein
LKEFAEKNHGKMIEVREALRVERNQPMHSSRECGTQNTFRNCIG